MFRANRYPKDWPRIRAEIRARAGERCEQCCAPNGATIARGAKGTPAAGTYMLEDGTVRDAVTGADLGRARGTEYDADRHIVVVLTVAHLDHDEQNNDPANLRALCQRCHLRLDAADNAARRRERRDAAAGQAPLPALAAMPEHRGGRRGH